MGLPQINISFIHAAQTAVTRSANGIVALLVADNTKEQTSYSYAYAADVDTKAFTEANVALIKTAFTGSPNRVIIERVTTEENLTAALARLKLKKFNWLALIGDIDADTVATWIIEQRDANKTFKAVLPTGTTDWNDPGIVSFNTDEIVCGTTTYTKAQFCPRIAGILAGLPMTRSATYYSIPEADSITESDDAESEITDGHLILINDGENIKIASENNSYHSLATGDNEELKSIKTIESMDLIRDDIRTTFENEYVGINNSYDNKTIFVGAVRQYFSELVRQGVLYDKYNNTADIDIVAQRAYLATKYDVSKMSDAEILVANTGKNVFVSADIQLCEAIENLTFNVLMS